MLIAAFTGWQGDYPSAFNFLSPLYQTGAGSNYEGYSNPEFDRLVSTGDRASTPEEATRLYQQAEDLLARDLPVIPLRYGLNNFGHSTRVTNVHIDLFFRVDLLAIERAKP